MTKKIQLIFTALTFLAFASSSMFAGTATSNMSVTATVTANCTISAGSLAFGTYDPVVANASTALNGSATLTVTCTNGAAATLTLGQGSNANTGSTDTAPLRRMKTGTNFLSYSLYQDSGRSTTWGNTSATGVSYTGTGSVGSVTVFAAVAAAQNVPAGSYADTVVATITF